MTLDKYSSSLLIYVLLLKIINIRIKYDMLGTQLFLCPFRVDISITIEIILVPLGLQNTQKCRNRKNHKVQTGQQINSDQFDW